MKNPENGSLYSCFFLWVFQKRRAALLKKKKKPLETRTGHLAAAQIPVLTGAAHVLGEDVAAVAAEALHRGCGDGSLGVSLPDMEASVYWKWLGKLALLDKWQNALLFDLFPVHCWKRVEKGLLEVASIHMW